MPVGSSIIKLHKSRYVTPSSGHSLVVLPEIILGRISASTDLADKNSDLHLEITTPIPVYLIFFREYNIPYISSLLISAVLDSVLEEKWPGFSHIFTDASRVVIDRAGSVGISMRLRILTFAENIHWMVK